MNYCKKKSCLPLTKELPLVLSSFHPQMLDIGLSDLQPDKGFQDKPVARGVAGRPASETPAVSAASRAHIECDINVDSLAYWNDLTGDRDRNYISPFKAEVRFGSELGVFVVT